jgi:hypothetical protein
MRVREFQELGVRFETWPGNNAANSGSGPPGTGVGDACQGVSRLNSLQKVHYGPHLEVRLGHLGLQMVVQRGGLKNLRCGPVPSVRGQAISGCDKSWKWLFVSPPGLKNKYE